MVAWPCLFKLAGDNELIYLTSEQALLAQCTELLLTEDDYIIDSLGGVYKVNALNHTPSLIKTNRLANATEVFNLIRAHEFSKAELCLTKIHFANIADAIKSLAY